ncbi:MAG: tRNA (guanosine(46)-N7)-methyltransferase TrmB [Nevskia sp.]|nr:tRNA (guanosine(46)-N7)-methyltransferase TrmB [Nevskia sp.]
MSSAGNEPVSDGQPPAAPMRAIRSFVRREGRITPAQKHALEELWPRYGVEFDGHTPLVPAQMFGRSAPLVVEIGFGSGAHLAAAARGRPDADFLGIEVHRPGVGRLLQDLAAAGLGNVRVICADAVEVLRQGLPAGSVDEIFILFPDPWPKKRHHKRRLIQPGFAALLAQALRAGGRLRLATDWADYAAHMLAVLQAEPRLRNTAAAGFAPRPATRPTTRFEARGLRAGHAVFDLDYERV